MCTYGFAFVPVNLLFLCLGILLAQLAQRQGVVLPEATDDLLPMYAATGQLGVSVVIFFTIGIVAASFSSADSAMTALTTSWCVDIMERPKDERPPPSFSCGGGFAFCPVYFALPCSQFHQRHRRHLHPLFLYLWSLLGLFAFGLFTKKKDQRSPWPFVAVASPLVCFVVDYSCSSLFDYHFGYELLMLNGLLTFLGLWLIGARSKG